MPIASRPPRALRFARALASLPALALSIPTSLVVEGCADAHGQPVDERYSGGGEPDRRCPRRKPRSGAACAASSARAQLGCHYGESRPSALCTCAASSDGPKWRCRSFGHPPLGPLPPPDLSATA
jgi:hypothetical protein